MSDWKDNISNPDVWLRIALVAVFFVLFFTIPLLTILVGVTALFQAVYCLLTGEPNERVRDFSAQFIAWIRQLLDFVSFNSEVAPFPFSDYPEAEQRDSDD